MKRLFASLCPALSMVLGGCVAVPYDTDSLYYPTYASTVTTQAYGGYYYPDSSYPYAVPRYSQPYAYPYYQPPVYTPPAPIIVPPLEFRYDRNAHPGWEHNAQPRHDQFRNGPRPDWNRPGQPGPGWDHHGEGRREWHEREPQQRNWQPHGGDADDWRGGRPTPWQQGFPRGERFQK